MLGHGRGVAAQVAGALAGGDEVLEGHKEVVGSQAVPVAVVGAGRALQPPASSLPGRHVRCGAQGAPLTAGRRGWVREGEGAGWGWGVPS